MIASAPRPRRFWPSSARVALAGLVALAVGAGFAGGRATLAAASQRPVVAPPAHTATAVGPEYGPVSYSTIVDLAAPAVVTVRVEKQASASRTAIPTPFRDFFGPQLEEPRGRREGGLGSGVIIRPDGHILTNNHVVNGAGKIRVDLSDGRTYPATLVGADEASDLAVLKIAASNLPTLSFGDSDRMKVGDVVLAFGNPLGVGQTVTMGIVSAKGRATGVGDGSYEDFLQTDAPINQGNSGGALVNLQGELVGINAQILSPSGGNIGLGFAIPSSMARAVADQLAKDGVVHRSKLGVTVQPMTPDLAQSLGVTETRGALVSDIESGSPADRAGMKQGDVIVSLNGQRVSDANALRNQIASTRPETTVSIEVMRGGKLETKSVRLIERERTERASLNPAQGENAGGPSFGMTVSPLTPDVAEQLELPRTEKGLVVTDVDPDGIAASVGIQAGDVIKRANDREVTTVPALHAAIDAHENRPVLMLVNRHGANLFVAMPRQQS
ncbi:MAG: DegQ family serine endoprotease [Acidobacteria bacterium]|nr:DegQ family serine endoprotease [Acidobacteriota bacterium]